METAKDPLELARLAIGRLATVVVQLGATSRRQICGTLGGELYLVAQIIDAETNEEAIRPYIHSLLGDVELFCNWPVKPEKYSYILLERISRDPGALEHEKAKVKIWHNIGTLTSKKQGAKLCEFLIKQLEKFRTRCGTVRYDQALEIQKKGGISDYPTEINTSVHSILQQHITCCECSSDGHREPHLARLLLRPPNDFQMRGPEGQIEFDILFNTQNPEEGLQPDVWQDVQLQVPRAIKRHRQARTVDFPTSLSDGDATKLQKGQTVVPLPPGKLCEIITNRTNACLQLLLQDNALHKCGFHPLRHIIDGNPSITLATLLRRYRLTARTKVTMAYILAHSMWRYYDSDWMNVRWTSASVCFVKERGLHERDSQLYAWKPYITAKFGDADGDASEFSDRDEIHLFPRIRALGIMLIEIANGSPIPASSKEQINGEYWVYMNAAQNKDTWADLDFDDYKDAVKACFDSTIFADAPYDPELGSTGQRRNMKARREILYEKIVSPIEELLINIKWMDKLTSIGALEHRKRQSTTDFSEVASPVNTQQKESQSAQTNKKTMAPSQREAGSWLREIEWLNSEIARATISSALPPAPVRVAVLDTGCDNHSQFFDVPANLSRLKGWKDFAGHCDHYADSHGHGTYLATLIMKIAPQAHIYVARVARTAEELASSSNNVAEAITWASDECKVDVISMSFGYSREQPGVSQAIRKVMYEREDSILLFAAASNSGANESERWPARHDAVISIRCTDSNGDFTGYNAPRNEHESSVFGTLGVDVPSAGLRDGDARVYREGSSVSTAVAVGMVAVILQYAAGKDSTSNAAHVLRKLKTRQGMQAMFFSLARKTTKERYLYVTLKKLMGIDDYTRWSKFVSAMSEV